MPTLRSLIDTTRRLGVVDATLWALARVLQSASAGRCRLYRYYFVAQPVPGTALAREEGRGALVLRTVDAADPLVAQFPRPPEIIAERYRMGAHCFVAEKEGRFVGFIWIKESEYPEDEVRCTYVLEPPGVAVWDFDVYIEPDFRYGRTFARLWDSTNAWLSQRGYRWSLSRISAFNPESLAAHRRLGIQRLGSATFVRLGRLQIAFLGRVPYVHVGSRDAQAPALRLRAPR